MGIDGEQEATGDETVSGTRFGVLSVRAKRNGNIAAQAIVDCRRIEDLGREWICLLSTSLVGNWGVENWKI